MTQDFPPLSPTSLKAASPDIDSALAVVACWSCHGPVRQGSPFCATCHVVQAPGQVNHFQRLGMSEQFDIDQAALERAYFDLQRRLHPDRFATRSACEQALSQQQATSLNEAYEVLRDPLRRADYLVHLLGSELLPEGCAMVNDQDLLMEAMELRESLMEAKTVEQVAELAARAADDIDICIGELQAAFAATDFENACRLSTRLKYLSKLAEETRRRRNTLRASKT